MMNYTFASATILLILITDPIGNIPIFANALKHVAPERRHKVILREILIAFTLLLTFMFVGESFLRVMNLSELSLQIGGGVILFLIALRMVFPPPSTAESEIKTEPLIVPLAIPAVAGPSALAVLMTLRNTHEGALWELYLAVGLAWFGTAMILLQASWLQRFLGARGLTAVERLTGMLLIMLSVDMLLDNLQSILHIAP